MPTARQACAIIDGVLRLPENTTRWHADRLRAAGLVPSTQGVPEQLEPTHIAAILLAVLTSSATVADYLDMRPIAGGPTFGETLAEFIARPHDLLDLRIDTVAPGAMLTYRDSDHGVRAITFEPAERQSRPAFDREVRIGPDVFINLAHAIAAAPAVRAGRPALRDRYRRVERAVAF
ncbi:hypothetical protein [Rhizobium rhizogenes]|uniref:hypothetical protein n=1 Tax=Rhizobium rhizogenes TaxID=359 RepID=UPI0005A05E73|nr:hypothetical protein [Rhizobium rhizogenes]NTG06477.1 hypothetical protein [Rhizobium rhizogenes]